MRRLLPLALALVVLLVSPAAARSERLEDDVLRQLNAVRAEHGAPPLRVSEALSAAASQHSRDMVRRGFFAHDSTDGSPFWKRVRRHYPMQGFRVWSVGENLAWGSPVLSAEQAVQMWLDSPMHRRNLLNPKWREIGLASAHGWAAPGLYGGRPATVLTADFGVRR